jgi:Flp pilus assembly protein TadD
MRAAIDRAFALDSALGEAHVALGILRLFFEWDWAGAERSLRRALELNPNDPHAWHHLANYRHAMGSELEAVAARTRSVALDPLNARTRIVLASDHMVAGQFEQALAELDRAQRLDPMNPLLLGLGPTLPVAAQIHEARGRPDDALQALLRIAALRGADAGEVDAMRDAFARAGMPGVWRRWLEMDMRQSPERINPMRVALLWMRAGDSAQALDWLERAHAAREPGLIYVQAHRALAPLHGHPRFARILTEMRFPRR